MLDRLKENEVMIGVIGALFCALFVGGLMAWALVRVLREAANGLLGQKKPSETKRISGRHSALTQLKAGRFQSAAEPEKTSRRAATRSACL